MDSSYRGNMAAARERLGLKKVDVARILGVCPNTVGYWEAGTATPGTAKLLRLMDLYEVDDARSLLEMTGKKSFSAYGVLARGA